MPLETGASGNSTEADVAVDAQGNAIAVWVQDYETRADIWTNRFVNGTGWGSPTAIETGDTVDILPMVAIDARGHGLVVWDHCNPDCTSVRAARFDPLMGWGLPATLATSVGEGWLYVRDLAIDGSGTSMVVWGSEIGGVWATRALLGRSWEAPTQIGRGAYPSLAVSPNGTAIAVWQTGGNSPRILASWFVPSQGWGSPLQVDPSNQANTSWPRPEVALSAAGIAFVAWNQQSSSNATRSDAWVARFAPGTGWSKATLLGTGSGFKPEVTVDSIGNAVVTWTGYDWDTGHSDLMADRYVNGLGWGTAISIARLLASNIGPGDFAMAGESPGTALVVFADWGGRISATQWVPGLGWTSPSQIGSGGSSEFGTYNGPAIAANAQGIAFAVWTGYDYSSNGRIIWASRFIAPRVAPSPLDLWISSPAAPLTNNPDVTISGTTQPGAAVTVDGTQVSVDPEGAFSYATILPEGPHTFLIVAYDILGRMSTRTITVVVDSQAPALTLNSPADGVTVFDGTIEVSGTTEFGVTLVVNGFAVAVAPDGSFSIRLALAGGRNIIVTMATDAAGNVATESETVTYVNPAIQDLAALRLVATVISVGVVALASLVLVMYRARGEREPSARRGSRNGSELEEPDRSTSQAIDAQKQVDGGALLRGLPADRRWPANATSVPVRLTAKERILLHLLHFGRYAEASEVPRELTQERIVEAAGIDRRHFTQYVDPLVRDGLVRERLAHVRGAVQRRRVYVVTEDGRNRALGVRDRIRSAAVRVRDASGVRDVTVAEALLESRGSMSVLDILRESIETGVVDLTR